VTPRLLFRVVAIAEAVTWSLLIAGLVLRATTGWALGVTIGGGIHGFVFLAYAGVALLVGIDRRWRPGLVVLAVACAIVPYATIPVEVALDRRGKLGGAWRREPDPESPDRTPLDALVRWFVRRPAVLIAVFVVLLFAIFTTLLALGPPGVR
jgi:integral membrane protein